MILLLTLLGCNDCGTYWYKGVRGVEWCGVVYGTEGLWTDSETEEDGEGVFELNVGHSVPPGEFTFTDSASLTLYVLAEDAMAGGVLGPEAVIGACTWWDYRDPSDASDDVFYEEPPVELELEYIGARPQAGWGGEEVTRRFRWSAMCGDHVLMSDGTDNVGMAPIFGVHALYDELSALGG